MSAALQSFKDSGRTQPLAAATGWGANAYADLGVVDITSGGAHPTADIPIYYTNTGNAPASNVIVQAAPAPLTTVSASGTYAAGTNVPVVSSANLAVGMAIDIVSAIADPGNSADYAYPLAGVTTRVAQAVVTAVSAGNVQLSLAVTCATGDFLLTAGTLAILGEIQVAPDNAGAAGVYGAQGASNNVAAGPIIAVTGQFQCWVKGNWATGNIEGTHKFAVRSRCVSG